MKYNQLGNSGLRVSVIGLGGWGLGGRPDWEPITQEEVTATVAAALDNGINLIDTAPVYGQSESMLGQALIGKRSQVILTTKCGLVKNGSWTDHDLRPQSIRTQLENSLRNLQTDYIDLYLVHYLDPRVPWQEVLETLAHIKQEGKIRAIGVCNVPPDILRPMLQTGLVGCVQDEYSLLHADKGRRAVKVCLEYQTGFMAYGTLCGGILSGKYEMEPNLRRADARSYFYKCYRGASLRCVTPTITQVKKWAEQKNVLPAQIALAWVLAQAGVSCALCGARNPEQVAQNAQAAEIVLRKEEVCALRK